MIIGSNKVWARGTDSTIELTKDTVYTHPSTKQCNYAYTHPTSKQCNYSVDLSNYATKSEVNASKLVIRTGTLTTSPAYEPSGTITYSGFTSIPAISICGWAYYSNGRTAPISLGVSNITKTSFQYKGGNYDSGTLTIQIYWAAFGY